MNALLTVQELENRCPANSLPLNATGDALDSARITLALEDATGTIVAHLPWLLDNTGEIVDPIPVQFAAVLYGICADIALLRLTDTVGSSEDERAKYNASINMLEKIDKEHQGGLTGPGIQASAVVIPNDEEGIEDLRFWKKGRVF